MTSFKISKLFLAKIESIDFDDLENINPQNNWCLNLSKRRKSIIKSSKCKDKDSLLVLHQSDFFRHDDVIKWKHFPCYWPFARGIHRSPVNSPHRGQWRGALMLSLICVWLNDWVNNREVGDLRRWGVTHKNMLRAMATQMPINHERIAYTTSRAQHKCQISRVSMNML